MITQEYMSGNNKIKIETAESIEDAEKNNFRNGEYSRYFVNGKSVSNYMTLIQYIVAEAKNNNQKLVHDQKKVEELRMQMLNNQQNAMRKQLESIRKEYGKMHVPDSVMKELDTMIEKLDTTGVRVAE